MPVISRSARGLFAIGLTGCQAVTATLPAGVPDPNSTHNAAGAQESYEGALLQFRTAFAGKYDSFVPMTGLFTDELLAGDMGLPSAFSDGMVVDTRVLPEFNGVGEDNVTLGQIADVYGLLQQTRGQVREARGALRAYDPGAPHALIGHLYAIEGYADVMLAEFFCSGIPLSTLNFGQDFTYQPGSSTAAVNRAAIVFFDSALTLAAGSDRILNMARVGKGRALLALGQYADAATAVTRVPDGFQYAMQFNVAIGTTGSVSNSFLNVNFMTQDFGPTPSGIPLTMVDREGTNGLAYESSGDPRSAWVSEGANQYGVPLANPVMYALTGDSPIVLASGTEARLIEAEAALQTSSGSWLMMLNSLRTDGTFTTQPDTIDPTKTDTLWNAGTGGVAGLKPLADPGTHIGRVMLLFDERAYWLFLTGHRQGDLRRLIRQYGLSVGQVYPVGPYLGAYNEYSTTVTAPIPGAERISNPKFTGCQGRGA